MKLPRILAAASPAGAPRTSGYGDAAAAPYVAAAAGIEKVGKAVAGGLVTISDSIRKREETLRKEEVASEAANLEATFEEDLSGIGSSVRTEITDHTKLVAEWRKQVDEKSAAALRNARTPEAAALLRRRMPGIIQKEYAGILKRRDDLRLNNLELEYKDTADKEARLARADSVFDDAATNARLERIYKAGATMIPLKGADAVFEILKTQRDRIIIEKAKRFADLYPENIRAQLDSRDLYTDLPESAKQEVLGHARAQVKEREAAVDKWYKRVDKDAETQARQRIVDLDAASLDRSLTLPQLENERRFGTFAGPGGDAAYRRLRGEITAPKDSPSDEGVRARLDMAVLPLHPRVSQADIDRAYEDYRAGRPGINHADYVRITSTRTSRAAHAETEARIAATEGRRLDIDARRVKTEARALARAEHEQAEQLLRAKLRIPAISSGALDKTVSALWFAGLSELSARSSFFNEGGESPMAVAQDWINRIEPVLQTNGMLRFSHIETTLRYPTPQALNEAKMRGEIVGRAYDEERRKFIDMDLIRKINMQRTNERLNPGTSSPKPSPATTPPAQRTPVPMGSE